MAKAGMTEPILPGEAGFSAEGPVADEIFPLVGSDPEESAPAPIQSAATPTPGALQNVATFFYAWDHLGTVRLVSNQDRTMLERHDYEPFGVELRPILNQTSNTHQFTGHERDQASGYDYMHFRFYGSTMGRFMKPDSIMGNLANPQSWNLYSYVHGNPVNFNDPTGHEAMEDWGSTFSPDNATPASWDGGQMFSFGLGLGEGLGTVGGDSARRLNDLFKSIEKPAQGGGSGANGSRLFPLLTFQVNPRYGGSLAPEAVLKLPSEMRRDATADESSAVLDAALPYMGAPYRSGGSSVNGIDCSHLVFEAINGAGIPYSYSPTGSMPQNPGLRPITAGQARAGDVVLFPGHAGLYNPQPETAGMTVLSATTKGVRWGKPDWFGVPMYFRVTVPIP